MKALFSLVAIALCGCTTPKMNTPSGQNEVTIHAPAPQVRDVLLGSMVERGYEIGAADDTVIVGDRPAGGTADVLFGTMLNQNVKIRARANLIAQADGRTRLIVRGYMVDGHYSENPLKPNANTQAWLERVKSQTEAR